MVARVCFSYIEPCLSHTNYNKRGGAWWGCTCRVQCRQPRAGGIPTCPTVAERIDGMSMQPTTLGARPWGGYTVDGGAEYVRGGRLCVVEG